MWTAEHPGNASRKDIRYPSDLTYDEWRLVEPFVPPARHGGRKRHVDVSQSHKEGSFNLGTWVNTQRIKFHANKLDEIKIKKLNNIGLSWDPLQEKWLKGMCALKSFVALEGHALVPVQHKEGDFRLGRWVQLQRQNRGTLSEEPQRELSACGFVWKVCSGF